MGKLRGLAAGAAGGLVGAALMGPVHMMASRISHQPPPRGEDATEKVAKLITMKVTGKRLGRQQKKKGGQIVHFAFGASLGALYGLLSSALPGVTAGAGTGFGAAVYVGAHALVTPALGLAPSPIENGPAPEVAEFAAHLAYGLATDAVRRLLS